jgi:hypothetical protein
MTFWGGSGSGSGSSDQCFWLIDPDPDPAIFVIDLQDASKKLIFNKIFSAYYFLKVHLHHFSKIKSQEWIKAFLTIFAWWLKDPDPYLWLVDPDPDPGGPKTCGSGGSGSGSGTLVQSQWNMTMESDPQQYCFYYSNIKRFSDVVSGLLCRKKAIQCCNVSWIVKKMRLHGLDTCSLKLHGSTNLEISAARQVRRFL